MGFKVAQKADKDLIRDFMLLYVLAGLGAYHKPIKISTKALAEKIGLSQQSASRHLIGLEKKGLIQRTTSKEGSLIKITGAGASLLKEIYLNLSAILEERPGPIVIEGEVFTGLGEGAYYVSQEGYRRQFIEKLGFDPYPGTLNLRITDVRGVMMRAVLDMYPGIEIKGFKNKNRSFGPVKCFPAIINGSEGGAVVIAERSHYGRDVIEVIAPVCLREKLGLRDGDRVKVEVLA